MIGKTLAQLVMTLGLWMGSVNSTLAMEPGEIARIVEENNARLERHFETQESDTFAFVAVSLSMPRASLEKLAIDARDAGIPLVFRGVKKPQNEEFEDKKELQVKVEVKPKTMIETMGKHLLVRGISDFEWLIETGTDIKIDPKVFTDFGIHKVPVMVIAEKSDCQTNVKRSWRAEGDVSLRYALEHLRKSIEAELHIQSQAIDSKEAKSHYNKNVIAQISQFLDRLGARP